MGYDIVEVEGPAEHEGVSVENPTILQAIQSALKQGWGNEAIAKIVGAPISIIDRERHKTTKQKASR